MQNLPEKAMIEFRLERIGAVEALGPLWRELDAEGSHSFFLSWTWIETWLRSLPRGVDPLILTASHQGVTIGAAIVVARHIRRFGLLRSQQLHLNSTGTSELDCITAEHNGFAGRAGADRRLWEALLRWFSQQSEFDEIVAPYMGDAAEPASTRGLHPRSRRTEATGYRCNLPEGGVDAILAGLSRNARQQLRRDLRFAGRAGEPACEAATDIATALTWFESLKELHIRSWTDRGKPHAFRHPFFECFHRALITTGVPQGCVEVLRISAGGGLLGYLYNFRWRNGVLAYQSGFDFSRRDCRPGYVSHLLAMARSASAGASNYDFLAGDNRLKQTFANERYSMDSWRCARPGTGAVLEASLRSLAEKASLVCRFSRGAR